jgi:hypothetical protein
MFTVNWLNAPELMHFQLIDFNSTFFQNARPKFFVRQSWFCNLQLHTALLQCKGQFAGYILSTFCDHDICCEYMLIKAIHIPMLIVKPCTATDDDRLRCK